MSTLRRSVYHPQFHVALDDRLRLQKAQKIMDASKSLLERAGLKFEEAGDGQYRVGEHFSLWPLTGYWRSDEGMKGYGCGALIAHVQSMGIM